MTDQNDFTNTNSGFFDIQKLEARIIAARTVLGKNDLSPDSIRLPELEARLVTARTVLGKNDLSPDSI